MKIVNRFKHQKVLVLGLARSGLAAAKLLSQLGALVTVNDASPLADNPLAQELLEEGIRVVCGHHPVELLEEDFMLMVKNPGIPYHNPMVEAALAKGLPVLTEVELAYLIAEAPIIGITGSNGKTTTTTMIAEVFKQAGQSGVVAGNIGFPASQVAQTVTASDNLIMELSSFQLMGIESFKPHIAVITNFMPSHLDYHGSFDDYVAAKWRIQENMTSADYLVLNFNQPLAKELAVSSKAQLVPFSTDEKVDGAYLSEGMLYFKEEAILPAADLGVPGLHNIENALATIAVAKLAGLPNQAIAEALGQFGGVKHRLQYLGQINHVKFYNDSKSTNVLATQKALSGFKKSEVLLILGGLDRGNAFDDLLPDIRGLKKIIVLGESAPRLQGLAAQAGVDCLTVADVRQAALEAFKQANPGDTILLSPANASWDMYANFEERGDEFIQAFESLKGE
ncbi:UDP-N-acetylmuramoyl-L-alanine--D-glutamate ligase [Streptococcus cuniculipharyngis]|uniref:UDP-N-acetylmuramoylalanine--D-glutamate ligase n=1 Tax=Streptococcus cuniculipharyngis TaxID=1562651 RepID=A0A5C5SAU5_9STRE|nr:UDP-N-acetylmuramoyl-L-alanine--D-glutamate ligase [Streptococcus cuniculipharyngis]TWS96921.1 UDP-N-acetylmuramoyl-L-alanine--D-glutamate ligase [Streptococcus cuniculipharyngis]